MRIESTVSGRDSQQLSITSCSGWMLARRVLPDQSPDSVQ
jgi:hypothetical protein